jgi:hypothetical protein
MCGTTAQESPAWTGPRAPAHHRRRDGHGDGAVTRDGGLRDEDRDVIVGEGVARGHHRRPERGTAHAGTGRREAGILQEEGPGVTLLPASRRRGRPREAVLPGGPPLRVLDVRRLVVREPYDPPAVRAVGGSARCMTLPCPRRGPGLTPVLEAGPLRSFTAGPRAFHSRADQAGPDREHARDPEVRDGREREASRVRNPAAVASPGTRIAHPIRRTEVSMPASVPIGAVLPEKTGVQES